MIQLIRLIYNFSCHHLVSELGVFGMAEGVTTRLQKEVGQLQKDMEKVETKLDGMVEQLRAEIRMEIMKGVETLHLELLSSKNTHLNVDEPVSERSGS